MLYNDKIFDLTYYDSCQILNITSVCQFLQPHRKFSKNIILSQALSCSSSTKSSLMCIGRGGKKETILNKVLLTSSFKDESVKMLPTQCEIFIYSKYSLQNFDGENDKKDFMSSEIDDIILDDAGRCSPSSLSSLCATRQVRNLLLVCCCSRFRSMIDDIMNINFIDCSKESIC